MRRLTLARLLILLAAVFLLLAPVLDGIDHDQLQGPHTDYTESTLCVLAATMTAGVWLHRAALVLFAGLAHPCFGRLIALFVKAPAGAVLTEVLTPSPPCPLRV